MVDSERGVKINVMWKEQGPYKGYWKCKLAYVPFCS